MNKPTVKLDIVHDHTNSRNMLEVDYFWQTIQEKYNIVIDQQNPDIIFIGPYNRGIKIPTAKCRVFITGEYVNPEGHNPAVSNINYKAYDLSQYDYSFTYDDTTDTNYMTPCSMRHAPWFDWIEEMRSWSPVPTSEKTKFATFIYRNEGGVVRKQFCLDLSKRKKVDCPGAVLNNMPNIDVGSRTSLTYLKSKIEFLKDYKFDISFENTDGPNYLTEKIIQPLIAGTVPIFWGCTNIEEYFDTNCIINMHNFSSFDSAIEYILEVDNNPSLYRSILNTKPIHAESKLWGNTKEKFFERIDMIFKDYIS